MASFPIISALVLTCYFHYHPKPCLVKLPLDLQSQPTTADTLIAVFQKLIVNGTDRLAPLYDCIMTVVANISPYIKGLGMVGAVKMLRSVSLLIGFVTVGMMIWFYFLFFILFMSLPVCLISLLRQSSCLLRPTTTIAYSCYLSHSTISFSTSTKVINQLFFYSELNDKLICHPQATTRSFMPSSAASTCLIALLLFLPTSKSGYSIPSHPLLPFYLASYSLAFSRQRVNTLPPAKPLSCTKRYNTPFNPSLVMAKLLHRPRSKKKSQRKPILNTKHTLLQTK